MDHYYASLAPAPARPGSEAVIIKTKPEPYCPICGARMALRKPKPGGKDFAPFWGCSTFPDCRGTYNIDEDGLPDTDYEEWEP